MKINRAAIKQNAKGIILTTKPSPILVGIVYLGIVLVLNFLYYMISGNLDWTKDNLLHFVTGNYEDTRAMIEKYVVGNYDYSYPVSLPIASLSGRLLLIAINIMTMMMGAGFSIYCLHICQFRKAGFGNLFDGFAIFFKVLWLEILMGIFVLLWTLLLVVPGIIALYRYRMALYIMIDNPQLSALDCISASKQMMYGHKWELFVLDLSFLGWYLLALFPFVTIWVTPYTSVTEVNFYLALRDMPKQGFDPQFQS